MNKQFLSNRVKNMASSATIEMSSKSRKLKEEGFGVIHINTIDFWRKPEHSLNALMDTLKSKERLSSQSDLE